jgi:hypothetical protein
VPSTGHSGRPTEAHLADRRTVYPQQGNGLEHPSALRLAINPGIQLGVRIGTKIIQEGLVLGLELLALHGCSWLALKA